MSTHFPELFSAHLVDDGNANLQMLTMSITLVDKPTRPELLFLYKCARTSSAPAHADVLPG